MTDDKPDNSARARIAARHGDILRLIDQRGFISISDLAETFDVSLQTIRRDLETLKRLGRIEKYRGGAGAPQDAFAVDYASRKSRRAGEKRRIAAAVAACIPDGAVIFIDIGTTMEAVAEALLNHRALTVVTNHIGVAKTLSGKDEFQVMLASGVVSKQDLSTTGTATAEFLNRFRVDIGIFGIGAVDTAGAMFDFDFRDRTATAVAMRISQRRFIAADHSKFHSEALVQIGHVEDADAVITDRSPPDELAEVLNSRKVELILA